jgi:transketolase
MDYTLPKATDKLGKDRLEFLSTFKKASIHTMLQMLKTSQSGHPGGSLSCLDFLTVLYAFRLSATNEKVVFSNGHISPAVYSVLAELGAIDKDELIKTYRQYGSPFEGHVTRHVPGIFFGTGPLGVGISAACGMALANKKSDNGQVFCSIGDGEMQEGQVHEAALFAAKEKLSNLTVFVDYNRVQLTDTLEKTCPIDVVSFFTSKGWKVVEIDGHNLEAIWKAIHAQCSKGRPLAIIAKTIMGKGVEMMEVDGAKLKSTWHGKTPKTEEIDAMLPTFSLSDSERETLNTFIAQQDFHPDKETFEPFGQLSDIEGGEPILYPTDKLTDCRSAYGNALADLAKRNKDILGGSADLSGSVKTATMEKETPDQYIEFGICEQNMVSVAGGLSLSGYTPFVSTFGAFMSSRAKDQARVNDLNHANVKMVSTHCGLSVGEDGPTHQAIDDAGSFVGMFNTGVCEPADPNHCDRIIRYVATHYGNFYVRMGRHKLPVLTKEDGSVFFDIDYVYQYGKCELLREGTDITIVATGACVIEALKARDKFTNPEKVEIIITSSIKKFDEVLLKSIKKTKHVMTVEDHNPYSGLGAAVVFYAQTEGVSLESFQTLGAKQYQLSGKPAELYSAAGIDSEGILKALN